MGRRVARILLVALLFPAACARGDARADATTTRGPFSEARLVEIGEADEGKAVRLPVGAALVVRLPVQMGTGYGWNATSVPDVLARAGDPEQETDAGAEHQRLRFDARARGSGPLVLSLRRPWDEGGPAIRTFRVSVTVE